MLRIITQLAEGQTELQRIRDRTYDGEIRSQEVAVRDLLESVKHRGNNALLEQAQTLKQSVTLPQWRLSGSEMDAAYQQISRDLLEAIRLACQKLEAFHQQRLPKSWVQFADDEVVVGKRYTPVGRAALYVAGDRSGRLSRVLMQSIPAKVARVPQIILTTPGDNDGKIAPDILVAAQEAGVHEIYRLGGAGAIAAFAYGTQTIPKVDVIAGTGELEVTLAKKMVQGTVATDTPLESSDLVIIADRKASPTQVAADLLAQAEQDPTAAVLLFALDLSFAQAVQQKVADRLQQHSQGILTEKALAHYGLIVVVDSLTEAAELSNQFAPQYLMLAVADPWSLFEQIRHAGTVFLGYATPKAVGDYLGGSGTILSSAAMVRYASALGVETFLKPSSLIQYSPGALKKLSSTLQLLAQAEGFSTSAEAIRLRSSLKAPNETEF